MSVNLNFEKRSNLYSIVKKGSIDYPVIWTGIDDKLITKTVEQMGYTYKLADYRVNFAYAETRIQYWSQTGISREPDRVQQILYIADVRDINVDESDSYVYLLIDSNCHIHSRDYVCDDQYKPADFFLGCGLRLTALEPGGSVIVSQKDVWADRLLVHNGRLGFGAKVVPFDYSQSIDWDHLIPWDIV